MCAHMGDSHQIFGLEPLRGKDTHVPHHSPRPGHAGQRLQEWEPLGHSARNTQVLHEDSQNKPANERIQNRWLGPGLAASLRSSKGPSREPLSVRQAGPGV